MEDNHNHRRDNLSRSLGYTDEVKRSLTINKPDLESIRQDRQERTNKIMKDANPYVARNIIPKAKISPEIAAAIKIQSCFRGLIARKEYLKRLIQKIEEEAEQMERKRQAQVEEGEMLIGNYRLRAEFEDNKSVRRNKKRLYETQVVRIQRAWRGFKRRQSEISLADEEINQEEERVEEGDDSGVVQYTEKSMPVVEDVNDNIKDEMESPASKEDHTVSEVDIISQLLSEIINKAVDKEIQSQAESTTTSPEHYLCDSEDKIDLDKDKLDTSQEQIVRQNQPELNSNFNGVDALDRSNIYADTTKGSVATDYEHLLCYSCCDLREKKTNLESVIQETSKSLISLLVEQDDLKSANIALTTHVEELTR